VITSEQMIDAYSSVGMPVGYHHWSYGKEFVSTSKSYKRGQMGLAYEIVINSSPCIAYLMEENTMTMQALVIAHAATATTRSSRATTCSAPGPMPTASSTTWCSRANYIAECEQRHGEAPSRNCSIPVMR
jgi:stage V sporulation protein R